jgi:NADH dehydrogenase
MFLGTRRATPHVVIVGCGFAGLEAARRLAGSGVRLTLVDRHAEFVFRPLLSQLLAGRVAVSSVVHPFREIVRSLPGATFQQGTLDEVVPGTRQVVISGRPTPYDYLLLATGATAAPDADLGARGTLTLENLEDWRRLDRVITDATGDPAASSERPGPRERRLVIVGGGPHGVELAAAMKTRLDAIVRRAAPVGGAPVSVALVHQGPRLLESYPEAAGRYAAEALARHDVAVTCNRRVTGPDPASRGAGEPPDRQVFVWAGGRRAPRLADVPGLAQAALDGDLSVPGHPEVLVLGDLAASNTPLRLPALASAAMRTGQHAARVIWSDLSRRTRPAFSYDDQGYGTYIGANDAVVVIGGQILTGAMAFAAKMTLHMALSMTSSAFTPEAAGRSVVALQRRLARSSPRGLGTLERTPPESARATKELRLESRVDGHTPAQVFDVARARVEDLFAHIDASILERAVTAEGHLRLRIQLGDWGALRFPIEVAFDPASHAIVMTTLATHPLRATAIIALRADGESTLISQTNRYQLGVASALAGRALGLEGRITSFWRAFHEALRNAAS